MASRRLAEQGFALLEGLVDLVRQALCGVSEASLALHHRRQILGQRRLQGGLRDIGRELDDLLVGQIRLLDLVDGLVVGGAPGPG